MSTSQRERVYSPYRPPYLYHIKEKRRRGKKKQTWKIKKSKNKCRKRFGVSPREREETSSSVSTANGLSLCRHPRDGWEDHPTVGLSRWTGQLALINETLVDPWWASSFSYLFLDKRPTVAEMSLCLLYFNDTFLLSLGSQADWWMSCASNSTLISWFLFSLVSFLAFDRSLPILCEFYYFDGDEIIKRLSAFLFVLRSTSVGLSIDRSRRIMEGKHENWSVTDWWIFAYVKLLMEGRRSGIDDIDMEMQAKGRDTNRLERIIFSNKWLANREPIVDLD